MLLLKAASSVLVASTCAPLCSAFAPSRPPVASRATAAAARDDVLRRDAAPRRRHEERLFADRTAAPSSAPREARRRPPAKDGTTQAGGALARAGASALLALGLSCAALVTTPAPPAWAADGAAIGTCLLQKCRTPLAKCILNPNCLANVICINTCNGKEDESGCQIDCGNIFENDVVGEFNKCAVSDMTCVPQKQDDGSYPVPAKELLVPSFDTSLFNGRWYISAGQNKLFDTFPCQVHFFTETAPGKFFGKLNWRIEEPDGEFFTRDAVQEFVQDPANPAHLINHDNEYLHYQDDWYILDYAKDGNKEGTPPFALVYYRGENDAWVGYGGAVVYTRDAQLPESLRPRLREAAKKVGFDFDKDFTVNDNTCRVLDKGEQLVLREKFAGKAVIQTERQLQQQAVLARTAASNEVGGLEKGAVQALGRIEDKAEAFEKELVKDVGKVEDEIVKDVVKVEQAIVKDVEDVEQEIAKDVVKVEKAIVKDVEDVEQEIVVEAKKVFSFGK